MNDDFAGRDFASLTGEEMENIRNRLIFSNRKIVLLNCRLPFRDLEKYLIVFRKAHLLGIENIRIDIDGGDIDEANLAEALGKLCAIGKSYGIGVLLENNSTSFLSTDHRISSIYKKIKNGFTGLIFNPNLRPYCWPGLIKAIFHLSLIWTI